MSASGFRIRTTASGPLLLKVANGVQADANVSPASIPVLFHLPDGTLALYYKAGARPKWWNGFRKFSKDEGATWSDAERLPILSSAR